MTFSMRCAAVFAVLVFVALFAFRLAFGPRQTAYPSGNSFTEQGLFENARKNYASAQKVAPGMAGQPIGDSQKYEKIATLTELTDNFDADRKRVDELIAAQQGIVQLERSVGLKGQRALYLGIGVPPDRFDTFIAAATTIGRSAQVEVVKNDKTNEYLQLRAKRTTLEKARAGIEALQTSSGSIDERIHVQDKLAEIEERLQELGVSLGEFDSQNELCTVKLTLREVAAAAPRPIVNRIVDALEWASLRYGLLGLGFFGLMIGAWLAAMLVKAARQLVAGS